MKSGVTNAASCAFFGANGNHGSARGIIISCLALPILRVSAAAVGQNPSQRDDKEDRRRAGERGGGDGS